MFLQLIRNKHVLYINIEFVMKETYVRKNLDNVDYLILNLVIAKWKQEYYMSNTQYPKVKEHYIPSRAVKQCSVHSHVIGLDIY